MSAIDNFLLNLPLPLIDHWGYLIIFLSGIFETLPILGAFFPGQIVIIFGGFLAWSDVLRLDAVLAVAVAGSITGDILAYVIGRKYGHDFIVHYGKYVFFNQARYEQTRRLVDGHAGKTLIVGRFTPFTRAVAAFIAGTSKVKFPRFIFFAVIGGIIWAGVSVAIGYIFGHGFAVAAKYFGRFIIVAVIAIVLIFIGYRLLNKRRHIFAKYHLYLLALNGLSIYVFCKMVEDYFDKESTYRLDLWLSERISQIWSPGFNKLMVLISTIFSPEVLFAIALAAAAYFFVKRQWYKAGLIFISSAGGLALGAFLKWLINRPRPEGGLVIETGLSFPSQHSLMAVIFFSLVLFGFVKFIKNRWLKDLFIAVNIFLILLVGFSRIYLNVHWFSDCLAGYALGLFWLTLMILVFRITIQIFGGSPNPLKLIKTHFKKNDPE